MSKVEDVSPKKISHILPYPDENTKKEHQSPKAREVWTGSLDFFVSALGYAVGVGNVWRFPYLCYNNGGGAFVIPYFVCMCIFGMPLVYLEMIVGQFTSRGPLTSWSMIKIFKGIGLSMNIATVLLIIYYNMVIAYCIYYFAMSLTFELPWMKCRPSFASPNCVDDFSPEKYTFTKCLNNMTMLKCQDSFNIGRCFNATTVNGTLATCDTSREVLKQIGWWKTSFPSQDFWNHEILQKSSGINETGSFIWQLFLSLFASWTIIYFMVFKGVKVSGKVVWFTALFPYVVLIILAIRGWMLPGADIGIKFYLYPDWSKLTEMQVWKDAAIQIFFSLSISYGGMNTLASYNRFNHNIQRDAILIPLANCVTSFFAGLVIFSYMGYLSKITQQDIHDIIQAGQGLAFVVYPYAVTTITGAPLWSCLFFIMMMLLGVDSTMACVETIITSVLDFFPSIKKVKYRKYALITGLSITFLACGLIFCFQSGTYWMEFFSTYVGDWAVLIGGFIECIIVVYFYGLKNLQNDIKCMLYTDKKLPWTEYIWWILWAFVTPTCIFYLVIMTLYNIEPISLGDYNFPEWSFVLGLITTALPLVGFFGWAFYEVCDTVFIKRLSLLTLITPDFHEYQPILEENKRLVRQIRGLEPTNDPNSVDAFDEGKF